MALKNDVSDLYFISNIVMSGPRCIELTIYHGNFAINGCYHGNRAQQPFKIKVSMVVTIDGKVTIKGTMSHLQAQKMKKLNSNCI